MYPSGINSSFPPPEIIMYLYDNEHGYDFVAGDIFIVACVLIQIITGVNLYDVCYSYSSKINSSKNSSS